MRNLKKILALALVFAMAFTFTAGAADFTDKAEIGASYVDDVNMLVELGVIGGYPDGSFGPQKNITRAEFAKMAYTLKYGSDTNGDLFAAQKSAFTDVEGNANVAWAKGYINYCANQKIVSGVGNNKFNPQGNITVAEATKMILVILGCDPAKEGFTGANWAANVTAKAIDLGVFDGWTGDPTTLATRELVAKLMRNAVFAPVYTYSAITGTGSQMDALGENYNITLGEKTMGLQNVTGIVVANESYVINRDADGKDIEGTYDERFVNDNGTPGDFTDDFYDTVTVTSFDIPDVNDDEAVIYYTIKDENSGATLKRTLTIPVGLSDEFLGNEVSVFFRADKSKDNWYTNVELIGDIMVTSDTVVYDVPATNVDLYPKGETESLAEITPYIGFTVDGVEKQIKADNKLGKVAKKVDIQATANAGETTTTGKTVKNVLDAFGNLAWVSDETVTAEGTTLTNGYDAAFFADMGTPSLSTFRFVSVDGGKSYSYIFKMVNDKATKSDVVCDAVTNYSEAKGVITLQQYGKHNLEDVVVEGDIATDDIVVCFRENGVLNIVKAEAVTGAVEAINNDGSAVIGGETYYLWNNANKTELGLGGAKNLAEYFRDNTSAMGASTVYYVYNNIVLSFEAVEETAVVNDYAVILGSSYDNDKEIAYVKLGFADNTVDTFEIGKYNLEDTNDIYADNNDKATDFANNAYFGMVVKCKVMDNGKVDLSANDFGRIVRGDGSDVTGAKKASYAGDKITYKASFASVALKEAKAAEGELKYKAGADTEYTKLYALNDSSVIFIIQGNPMYDGSGVKQTTTGYKAVSAKAYKLADIGDVELAAINKMYTINKADTSAVAKTDDVMTLSYALNSKDGLGKGIIAAAMTIDKDKKVSVAAETNALAYVVSATQCYNVATQKYYREMTIIDENGLVSTKTVDDFQGVVGDPSVIDITIGTHLGRVTKDMDGGEGTFVAYKLGADGIIANMSKSNSKLDSTPSTAQGLYLVNAIYERNGSLFFYDTVKDHKLDSEEGRAALKFSEDGYEVITIDDDEYAGEYIVKVSERLDTLKAGEGNAVIQVNKDGEIVRVFSFVDGYKVK